MLEPAATEAEQSDDEARDAGLSLVEARMFAESDTDIGLLRKLVKANCPPRTIADILT